MRVTDTAASRNFLLEAESLRQSIDRANNEVSSGRKLLKPSDDPIGAERSLLLRANTSRNDQYLTNAQRATSKLEQTDSVIENVQTVLNKTLELTVQGLSGSTTPQSRTILASQIGGIRDRLLGLANTTFQGNYMFAGSATTTLPYADVAGVATYSGNAEAVYTRVDDAFLVQTNLSGPELFAAGGDVFATLSSIQLAMTNNDEAGLQQGLNDLRDELSNTDVVRGKVAASLNYLESRVNSIQTENLRLAADRSSVEDANMVESIVKLNQSQTALQASIGANAHLLQLSLLDFLR